MINYVPLIKGFSTSAGLIMAIGAQNAFVLKQGIRRSHMLIIALLCSLIDAFLIILGVGGVGQLIVSVPNLLHIAKYGGMIFCFLYGARSFIAAFTSKASIKIDGAQREDSLISVVGMILAVSFLNPHTYLDTMILIGSIGAQFEEGIERISFIIGAVLASVTWFFALAYGASYLAPLFSKSFTWRILDFFVGCIMWSISISLYFG